MRARGLRNIGLSLVTVCTLTLFYGMFCLSAVAADQPNIILLMGDDHGWDETGYNGHPYLKTPVLDEMASAGLRLDHFYSAHPSCSPTRGSVLTGRHPNRYGVFSPGWSIRPEEITLAQILGRQGYDCAHFGKWHLGPVKKSSPTNPGAMGFDHWLSHDNLFECDPVLSRDGGPPQEYPGEGSEVIVAEAIKYLSESQRKDSPFFLVIWFGSPHEPYSGLPKDLALYENVKEQYKTQSIKLTSNETGEQVTRPLGEVLQARYAEITAMDRSIGNLREWLAKEGLRDNTLLWYCGDNGSWADGAVTSPLRGYKGMVYEGGVHVPAVIEWPARIPQPQVSDVNSVTSDILPTVCDLLKLPLPDRPIDGESLVPVLEGGHQTRQKPICFWNFQIGGKLKGMQPYLEPKLQEGTTPLVKKLGGRYTRNFKNVRIPQTDERFMSGSRAILDNQYKLVVHGTSEDDIELFDLQQDPGEQHDLSAQMPAQVEALQQQLHEWQLSVLESVTGADY